MTRQTQAQKQAEAKKAESVEAVVDDMTADAMETAIERRKADHDNTSDQELIELLMRTQKEAEELKAELAKVKADNAAKSIEDDVKAAAKGAGVSPDKAVTFWLADPRSQLRLWDAESQDYIKFHGGKFIAVNDHQVELIEKHLAGVAFKQDREKAHSPHPVTGYAPLSDAAYDAHIALVTRA